MSVETWLAEYYPVEAERVGKEDAVEHSIQKWKGAREEALRRHGLTEMPIEFNIDSCALCQLYDSNSCASCPLYLLLGYRCDRFGGPYTPWTTHANPEPMIRKLEELMEIKEVVNG